MRGSTEPLQEASALSPKADVRRARSTSPLCAKSGHRRIARTMFRTFARDAVCQREELIQLCGSGPNNRSRAYSDDGNHALSLKFHFAKRFPVEIVPDVLPNILRDRNASGYGLL
jgi:hypothetical protein